MLSLFTCSVSHVDDFDPFEGLSSPVRGRRRVSKSLRFIKSGSSSSPPPRRRRVTKMTIGKPTDFRHEFHLGKDVASENVVTIWDTARWEQELKKESKSSLPPSIAPCTAPSSPTNPIRPKRNSITPQKRKPVPSIVPDLPPMSPSPMIAPHAIPLPPSPFSSSSSSSESESESSSSGPGTSDCEFFETSDDLRDASRRSLSTDGETVCLSDTVHHEEEEESQDEIAPAPRADVDDQ